MGENQSFGIRVHKKMQLGCKGFSYAPQRFGRIQQKIGTPGEGGPAAGKFRQHLRREKPGKKKTSLHLLFREPALQDLVIAVIMPENLRHSRVNDQNFSRDIDRHCGSLLQEADKLGISCNGLLKK